MATGWTTTPKLEHSLAKTGPAHTKHRSVETGSQTFTKIDELQHTMAHEHWKNFDKTKENSAKTSDCHDLFIRPMEQLFSKDRPMSASMLEATKDSIKLVWLTKQIAHIARIEQWVATDFHPLSWKFQPWRKASWNLCGTKSQNATLHHPLIHKQTNLWRRN